MSKTEIINNKITEITKDIGLVFFASLFVGPIATGTIDFTLIVWGLVVSIATWQVSIIFAIKTLK